MSAWALCIRLDFLAQKPDLLDTLPILIVRDSPESCIMSDKNDAKVEPVPTEGQAPVDGEKMVFQAEVNQLLQLMIHSLYSNQEIFLRGVDFQLLRCL